MDVYYVLVLILVFVIIDGILERVMDWDLEDFSFGFGLVGGYCVVFSKVFVFLFVN